jgi:hypothetical protein
LCLSKLPDVIIYGDSVAAIAAAAAGVVITLAHGQEADLAEVAFESEL